ncbi:MAG: cupredoxin domain-containing protein, partial [Acidimicrobiales bacterium]
MVRPLRVLMVMPVAVAGFMLATPAPAGAGGGCHAREATEQRTTVVEMQMNCFAPTVAHVEAGDTVVFRNADEVAHTVTGLSGSIAGTTNLTLGQEARHRFDAPGTYPYSCILHPGMVGAVVVGGGSVGRASPMATRQAAAVDAVPAAAATAGGEGDGGSATT